LDGVVIIVYFTINRVARFVVSTLFFLHIGQKTGIIIEQLLPKEKFLLYKTLLHKEYCLPEYRQVGGRVTT
jgi:hypothetical protein